MAWNSKAANGSDSIPFSRQARLRTFDEFNAQVNVVADTNLVAVRPMTALETNSLRTNSFFFRAVDTLASELAEVIADHYAVSVLVHGESAAKKLSGRLVANNLDETMEAFGFLLGERVRVNENKGVFMVGGPKDTGIVQIPAYGLRAGEIEGLLREGAKMVGDRIVMETDQTRAAQVREVLAVFGDRKSLMLEIVLLDVADQSIDRLNAWLDQVSIGFGVVARSYFSASTLGAGGALAGLGASKDEMQRHSYGGPVYDIDARGLFAFLETERGAKVKLREQVQILSGRESEFVSGEVVETPLIVREPETGADLVQRIERRTVGLRLRLAAQAWVSKWHLELDIEDSVRINGERTTSLRTERIIEQGQRGYIQLASFTRDVEESQTKKVPVLGSIKGIGKAFTKAQTIKGTRQVLLLARPIWGNK